MHDVLAITHNVHIIRHDHVKYDVIIAYAHTDCYDCIYLAVREVRS